MNINDADADRGLYEKFVVRRMDGRSAPGEKHETCDYFVLDLTHDLHALSAIRAYAESCAETHPLLSLDLKRKHGESAPVEARTCELTEADLEQAIAFGQERGAWSHESAVAAWRERRALKGGAA